MQFLFPKMNAEHLKKHKTNFRATKIVAEGTGKIDQKFIDDSGFYTKLK